MTKSIFNIVTVTVLLVVLVALLLYVVFVIMTLIFFIKSAIQNHLIKLEIKFSYILIPFSGK